METKCLRLEDWLKDFKRRLDDLYVLEFFDGHRHQWTDLSTEEIMGDFLHLPLLMDSHGESETLIITKAMNHYGVFMQYFGECEGCKPWWNIDTYEDLLEQARHILDDIRWFPTKEEALKFMKEKLEHYKELRAKKIAHSDTSTLDTMIKIFDKENV